MCLFLLIRPRTNMDEIEQDTTGFTPVFVIAEVRIDCKFDS